MTCGILTRLLGFNSLDLAEDIVQDNVAEKQCQRGNSKGIPENPAGFTPSRQKPIPLTENSDQQQGPKLGWRWSQSGRCHLTVNQLFLRNEIEDSQLRMIFACCHPSIPYESQLALTLKTLCGLSIAEIR